MKKFLEIGSKTGLGDEELGRFSRFSLAGLAALCLSALAGCVGVSVQNSGHYRHPSEGSNQIQPAPGAVPQSSHTPPQVGGAGPDGAPTGAAPAAPANNDPAPACGPYPGYPCGTRYYTVSPGDFRRAFGA